MKNIIILLTLILSWLPIVQENTITATYNGMEENTYYFTDGEGNEYAFQSVEDDVLATYDLSDESLLGLVFKITYRIEEELDDDGDTYENQIITNLSLVE